MIVLAILTTLAFTATEAAISLSIWTGPGTAHDHWNRITVQGVVTILVLIALAYVMDED